MVGASPDNREYACRTATHKLAVNEPSRIASGMLTPSGEHLFKGRAVLWASGSSGQDYNASLDRSPLQILKKWVWTKSFRVEHSRLNPVMCKVVVQVIHTTVRVVA